ncbi:MAG: hypothetical protein P8Y69_06060, partial [Gammaproteobacteria bacterium]
IVQRLLTSTVLLSLLPCSSVYGAAEDDWRALRTVEGVPVEFKPTESGFDAHRGETSVCANIDMLEGFVADTSRFPEWIPFTRSARLLDQSEGVYLYYVRSTTPWPLKDRDMVYRITRHDTGHDGVRLVITGLPDHQPLADGAVRIRAAAGEWYLAPAASGIRVSYELFVDPGPVPPYFANRRMATVVGRTLANLAARFPCTGAQVAVRSGPPAS